MDFDLDVILDVDVDAVRIVYVVRTYSVAARSLFWRRVFCSAVHNLSGTSGSRVNF